MEQIFLQQLTKLKSQMTVRDIDPDEAQAQLEQHLRRAQANKMPLYLAETLNGFGILAWVRGDLAQQRHYYESAYEVAETLPGDHEALKGKLETNLAIMLSEAWEFDGAASYAERALARTRQEATTLTTLYSNATLLGIYINQGRFDDAFTLYEQTWAEIGDVKLDSQADEQQDYMLLVSHLMHKRAQINIAQHDCDATLDALQLAAEQLESVEIPQANAENALLRVLHVMTCQGDSDRALKALALVETGYGDMLGASVVLEAALLCSRVGQLALAQRLAAHVLATAPDDAPSHVQAELLIKQLDAPA